MVAAGRQAICCFAVSGEWGGKGGRDIRERGGREREDYLCFHQHQHEHSRRREERGEMQGLPANRRQGRRRVFPRSLCKSRIPEHRCHMTTVEGGWDLHCSSTAPERGAVSAQRWCHDLFWGSDVKPLQWAWSCCTVVQHFCTSVLIKCCTDMSTFGTGCAASVLKNGIFMRVM